MIYGMLDTCNIFFISTEYIHENMKMNVSVKIYFSMDVTLGIILNEFPGDASPLLSSHSYEYHSLL